VTPNIPVTLVTLVTGSPGSLRSPKRRQGTWTPDLVTWAPQGAASKEIRASETAGRGPQPSHLVGRPGALARPQSHGDGPWTLRVPSGSAPKVARCAIEPRRSLRSGLPILQQCFTGVLHRVTETPSGPALERIAVLVEQSELVVVPHKALSTFVVEQQHVVGAVLVRRHRDLFASLAEGLDDFCGLRPRASGLHSAESVRVAAKSPGHLPRLAIRHQDSRLSFLLPHQRRRGQHQHRGNHSCAHKRKYRQVARDRTVAASGVMKRTRNQADFDVQQVGSLR